MDFDSLRDGAGNGNQGAQPHQQPGTYSGPHPNPENVPPPASAEAAPAGAWLCMVQAKRWLLRKADKQPFYVDGTPRSGKLDTPDDWQRLATYQEAKAALAAFGDRFAGLGFALGPVGNGGHWQGIDLDKIIANRLADLANCLPGYVEFSPSGEGAHAIGYGAHFAPLGSNGSGIEAYSGGRYFTVTETPIRYGDLIDLAPCVMQMLAPRHGKPHTTTSGVETVTIPPETITELRSALTAMRSDDHTLWVAMGHALRELGELGRSLWMEWSQTSDKYEPKQAAKTWDSFNPDRTGYQAVFAEAQRHGWVNPRSKAAQGTTQSANPSHQFRLMLDSDLQHMQRPRWLVKHIIPDTGIGAIYGQSGTFKTFFVLDLMAHVSNGLEWFGHRVTGAPTVYVPFEGQGGVPKRVQAWRLAQADAQGRTEALYSAVPDDIRTNIAVIMDRINLREQADRDVLVATLTENGWAGGVLCIDTLAHASNGIEENSSEMGEMIAVLNELQHRLGGVVLVIHHAGKDEGKGMRGWSGIHAAMDFIIECQRPDRQKLEARFMLTKVKDDEDGKVFDFSVKKVHIGYDEDGDEITSLTVVPPPERHEREMPSTSIEQDREDDQFVWQWVFDQVAKGEYPSANSLEGQREQMGIQHKMSQKRLRDAIHRLKAASRVVTAPIKSPSGNAYLRAMEMPHAAE